MYLSTCLWSSTPVTSSETRNFYFTALSPYYTCTFIGIIWGYLRNHRLTSFGSFLLSTLRSPLSPTAPDSRMKTLLIYFTTQSYIIISFFTWLSSSLQNFRLRSISTAIHQPQSFNYFFPFFPILSSSFLPLITNFLYPPSFPKHYLSFLFYFSKVILKRWFVSFWLDCWTLESAECDLFPLFKVEHNAPLH